MKRKQPVKGSRQEISKECLKSRPPSEEHSVRKYFTMLRKDVRLIAELRRKYGVEEAELHDSEVVRAGLYALKGLPDEEAIQVICRLEKSKTGPKPK